MEETKREKEIFKKVHISNVNVEVNMVSFTEDIEYMFTGEKSKKNLKMHAMDFANTIRDYIIFNGIDCIDDSSFGIQAELTSDSEDVMELSDLLLKSIELNRLIDLFVVDKFMDFPEETDL